MKQKLLILLALLSVVLWVAPAGAVYTDTIPFMGTDSAGNPVSAMASFTFNNGSLTVDLWNLTTPMLDAGQVLSDLSFVLNITPTGTVSLATSGGTERTMLSTAGTFSDSPNVAPGWALISSGNTITLDDLAAGGSAPTNTIIGPTDSGTGVPGLYSSANASIVGTDASGYHDAHSPFMFGTEALPVQWVLNVPGLTEGSGLVSVTFSFGTTPGDNHTVVPIPPSVLLLGSGLLGIGFLGWRRKKL
jgi:hypothetical protein